TRELLNYLEKLEISLSSFSYGELGTEEAVALKKSFEQFKHGLEDKVFGVDGIGQLQDLYDKLGIQGAGGHRANDQVHGTADLEFLLRSEEHTSELQSREKLVCRLLLE